MQTTVATITSKRQLTIPKSLFEKVGLSSNSKVVLEEIDGVLVLKPVKSLLEELSGSVEIPEDMRRTSVDKAISEAKNKRFTAVK